MKSVIDIFTELGTRLSLGAPREIVERASRENGWFRPLDIALALDAIGLTMLRRDALREWLNHYPTPTRSERVLIVMAGNIPLVGFFDLLCVVASGHRAVVKLSHKDRALMGWIIEILKEIEPRIPIFIYSGDESIDRVIATGGEAAIRHFREQYGAIPSLLRGSRHSVAILSGEESEEELQLLLRDIYNYSGLGCRSVSMLILPEGYSLSSLPTVDISILNPKYRNNYLQTRALLTLSGEEFIDSGASCLVHQESPSERISTLAIREYRSQEELQQWIMAHEEELQCIVSRPTTISHPRRVDFGRGQYPTLFDYADGCDTMKFLRQ